MKLRSISVFLGIAALLLAIIACSTSSTTPGLSNIRMTTDDTGKTPTSSYAPGDEFFVFADISGLQAGQTIEAKWYAVNVEGVDANSEINTSDYSYESNVAYVYFQLTTSDGGDWPPGSYRVELYLDGTKVGEQGFTVQ
ncbi:MAG TPA: hypothetical protein VIU38_07395 [Anaerolineales bacterium]